MEKLKMKLIAEEFEKEEFYEEIEAPKFVDLTLPDQFLPDDRYWFCSRVGCDLKHEEEIDLEAIYKNFALRAMAARSPNMKLRKILSKRQSENKKCPLSAPPKPSKPRIPRLALLSSVSRKLVDVKDPTQPAPKPAPTPKARVKHVAAKYMTTPRVKKPAADPNLFKSVRNQPRTSSRIPRQKVVAKALTFTPPKKVVKAKALQVQNTTTPIKKICDGMKKLEITDQKKGVIGELHSAGTSRKVLRSRTITREDKGKSSRCLTSKSKGVGQRKNKPVLCEVGAGNNSTQNMDINARSRSCSSGASSKSTKPDNDEGIIGSSGGVSSETPVSVPNPSQDTTKEKILVDGENVGIEAQNAKDNHDREGSRNDQNSSSDEKENAPFSDINRDFTANHSQSGTDDGVKHETSKKSKVTENRNTLKENRSGGVGVQGVKYKKKKTTNPKPFRLRTDERMILKEANLERKQLEDENQTTMNSTGKVQSEGRLHIGTKKSKKNQVALIGNETPQRSTLTKDKLVSCKSEHKDGHIKAGTSSVRLTFLQKCDHRTTERSKVSRAKPEGDQQAFSSHGKRRPTTIPETPKFHPLHVPKSCTKNMEKGIA